MDIAGNEWAETGGNNANSSKVLGNNSCESHGFADISSNSYYFRCCFIKH